MPVGTENQNVGLMVEFDSLEQKETYYASTDSDLNRPCTKRGKVCCLKIDPSPLEFNSAGRRPKRVVQQRPEGEEAPLVGLAVGVYSTHGVGGRGDKIYLQQNTWAENAF